LLSDEDIEIDYSKPFERVYADWAWKRIHRLQSLDVFSVCADSAGTSDGEQSPVPSWTPDLRFHMGRDNSLFFQVHQLPNAIYNEKWSAGSFEPLNARRSPDGLKLALRGVQVDRIVKMSDVAYLAEMAETQYNPLFLTSSLRAIISDWEDMIWTHFNPSSIYSANFLFSIFTSALLRDYKRWGNQQAIFSIFPHRTATLSERYAVWRDIIPVPDWFQSELDYADRKRRFEGSIERALFAMINGCQMFITERGRLGMIAGNSHVRTGDGIWVLPGADTPCILREAEDAFRNYRLLGPCYVNGYMHEKAVLELIRERGYELIDINLV